MATRSRTPSKPSSWRVAHWITHGEAVAIGLSFASRLARHLGRVGDDVVVQHDAVLDFLGLPRTLPDGVSIEDLVASMSRDKKAHHDLTFVLAGPSGFGSVTGVAPDAVRDALKEFGGVQ